MEEKSIEQLRREAQELYQSKLQAYQQAQEETTQKKETAPKLFLKTNGLKKFFEPVFFKSEKKKIVQSEKQEVVQSKPQGFQQIKIEIPQILKKPGITITEEVFEPAFFESGSREKNIDELRRESLELYQSKLQAYQQTQKEAAPEVFQKSRELKKDRWSVLRKKNSSAGKEEAETAALSDLKKSFKQRNNLFVISVFILMVIIVLVKLLLFMP